MSEEGSCDDGTDGLLPEPDVLNFMRRMADMNLPVSPEEIQVNFFSIINIFNFIVKSTNFYH